MCAARVRACGYHSHGRPAFFGVCVQHNTFSGVRRACVAVSNTPRVFSTPSEGCFDAAPGDRDAGDGIERQRGVGRAGGRGDAGRKLWHLQDSQGQKLALAFKSMSCNPLSFPPLRLKAATLLSVQELAPPFLGPSIGLHALYRGTSLIRNRPPPPHI